MRHKIRILSFTVFGIGFALMLLSAVTVSAQDGGDDEEDTRISIAYGEIVEGVITNNDFAVDYVFAGEQGDVVVIEMRPIEIIESDLIEVEQFNSPQVEVFDPEGILVARTTRYDRADLALRLASDGEYLIRATREDGEIGISTGEYTLALIQPETLLFDRTTENTIRSDQRQYYLVPDIESFSIDFNKIDGSFSPEVAVLILADDELFNDLNTFGYVAAINGLWLESGTININGQTAPDGAYIILIHQALFDYRFAEDPVLSDYTLRLTAEE